MENDKKPRVIDFMDNDGNQWRMPVSDNPHNTDDISRFRSIIKNMLDTFKRKNADYGNAYSENVADFGLIAGYLPIQNKCNRIKTLIKGNKPLVNESLRDSLLDLANYAVMMLVELDKMDGK
ncbi:MAG: DUF1599 domain-containing protein [Lachnospiraceae bacterium]|nr:DUF1599 domain-containing protein [Lachnospiraceae bacterium]